MSATRWPQGHERDAPVTYAEAKALFEQARVPEEGKPLPNQRMVRVLKVKGGFKFQYRAGNRTFLHRDRIDLFTVRRDGTFLFHADTRYHLPDQARHVLSVLTPTGYVGEYGYHLSLLNPDHGPAPAKETSIPRVPEPRWRRKDSSYRDEYDQNVATYGSLEEWFEAYDAWSTAQNQARRAYEAWADTKLRRIFVGATCTREGVLFKRSIERHETRQRVVRRQQAAFERVAQRDAEREKLRQERERAKRYEKAVKWARAAGIEVEPAVAHWLLSRGITPNDDGTVTLVKATLKGFRSGHGATYTPGTRVEAFDYVGEAYCGHGLHFSPTFDEAKAWSMRGWNHKPTVALLCKVDLATLVVVDEQKVKARFCHVIGEVPVEEADVTSTFGVGEVTKTAVQSAAARIADKMAKAARKAIENNAEDVTT